MATRNLSLAKSLTFLTDDGIPNFASGSDITLTADSDTGTITTGVTVAGQSASAVNNYNSIDSLPLSNLTAGTLSYVQSTGTFYYSTGAGWYKITTTNSAPIIVNGAETSYMLATDGTSTVISLSAFDADSTPLTWSYNITSGALNNTATISQDSSVFTITPSTDSANVGSFDITFSVTDGTSIATDTASFTLVFEINAFLDGTEATYSGNSVYLNGRTYGGNWSRNGLVYVATGTDYTHIVKFNTPFDLTSVASNTRYILGQIGNSSNNANSITFNNDGTTYFRSGGYLVEEISVDPPYSFSNETLIGNTNAPQQIYGITFSVNGEYLFYITGGSDNGGGDTIVRRKDLVTPFTLVGLSSDLNTPSQSFNPSATDIESFYGIWFTENGLFMYLVSKTKVSKFELSVGWDITTATYTGEYVTITNTTDQSSNSFNHSVAFDSDYSQMFVTDRSIQYIYGFTL